tara:strand:- start:1564 stop:5739 length:4176 start_codon:yes stop_codon:yes gene_type:complete
MTRTVPGSGAVIEPIFDEIFGVRAVEVLDGGNGYTTSDPPRLTITGCGNPDVEALLYPIIDDESGRIIHVRVLARGRGYNPLRLQIFPEQETPNVVTSFDIKRIFQTHPNSPTTATFTDDRLRIVSDNHPKPSQLFLSERQPGGSDTIVDRSFDQTFIYRGGKDVPHPDAANRQYQGDKAMGIMANGGLLHTPEWGQDGNPPPGFTIDAIKYPYIKNNNAYDAVLDNQVYYYQTNKLINEFDLDQGVFDYGKLELFFWQVKVEHDNILIELENLDQTIGSIEVGRIVDCISSTAKGEVAKIVTNNLGNPTKIYLRNLSGDPFQESDVCLGANGFQFRVSGIPRTFPNGIFYIEFGQESHEFGNFAPGVFYFAPQDIKVQQNYLIIWDQSHPSNNQGGMQHPMRFSLTADGTLNGGTLYYNSTGISEAPAADYEDEYKPLFLMNPDENNRIYYYCHNHRYMSGYLGDEGYMVLSNVHEEEEEEHENTYYYKEFYQSDVNDPNTIDYSRHPDGHSKILGMSFDGYPIYGPWGYNSSGAFAREVSGYRLKTTAELPGNRPQVNTVSNVTFAVTVSNGQFQFDGSRPAFLTLERGKTYIFNQNDASNNNNQIFVGVSDDGWHGGSPPTIGDTSYLLSGNHITYWLDGSQTTYNTYVTAFNTATTREIRFHVPVNAPIALYLFGYSLANTGIRCVIEGYVLGDLTEDYIHDSSIGTLDPYNGKFGPTPEYPNGTYAYYMTSDSSSVPTYPYAIGNRFYGTPLFEGDTVPPQVETFPTGAEGDVVLNSSGQIAYIRMTKFGDNYFGAAQAKILGGQGTGALASPIVQTVTGLSLLNSGREYATPPTLIFEGGGGGVGAEGAAEIDTFGRVSSISIVDEGEFYQEPPYVLITGGGGIGAKAIARIDQGVIVGIDVTDPGSGYINPPNIVFTKLVNLKRKTRARQSYNSQAIYLTGLVKDLAASDTEIFVDTTTGFPGSGELIVNTETITYTGKATGKFFGLTRGVNFNYDQRIILDATQNNQQDISTYQFNVGDRVIRRIDNANNKVAKVYDWNPVTRELLVTFEVDELAFIDGGIPSTLDAIVQFDAGVAASASNAFDPHQITFAENENIVTLTDPIGRILDTKFVDVAENAGAGDGIPDLFNTGTDYENQISLDGGIYNSLYGIEETQGGTNTTLFAVADQVKDGSIPFKYATVETAGTLTDGVDHSAKLNVYVDLNQGNGQNYVVNDLVIGDISGVRGTVLGWDPNTGLLEIGNVIPFNTGNINIGIAGYFYEFSARETVIDFIVQNPGTNYTAPPTVTVENIGDIQATASVNMTAAGDQVASLTITNGGYGIKQNIDESFVTHPTVTFTNNASDSTGSGAVAQAVLGGERIAGNTGASYRIKRIEYQAQLQSKE